MFVQMVDMFQFLGNNVHACKDEDGEGHKQVETLPEFDGFYKLDG